MEGKRTYIHSAKKREIRNLIFSIIGKMDAIGMPGPDIIDYLTFFGDHPSLKLYEYDPMVVAEHIPILQERGITKDYYPADIYHAPFNKDFLYDLDFCFHIDSLEKYVRKFDGAYEVFTFNLRTGVKGGGREYTINKFLTIRNEFVNTIEEHRRFQVMRTNKSNYIVRSYSGADGGRGTPMLIIANVKDKL